MSNNAFATTVETDTTTKEATNMTEANSNAKIVTTLKGGSGYDAPWVVIHTDTPAEALAILENDELRPLLDQAKKVGQYFSGGNSKPANNGKPAGASQPSANAPECPPGWTYREGVSKSGKHYKAYFPPQGSNDKPIWL